jgi:hypothetical protein
MTFQYHIWQSPDGKQEHYVFNQKSMRVVYPPSHPFVYKPIGLAITAYENRKWRLLDSGAWRGDKIDEYMEAMHKMYPKALQEKTKGKGKRNAFKFVLPEEDSP